MELRSFEELACLLPEKERQAYERRQKAKETSKEKAKEDERKALLALDEYDDRPRRLLTSRRVIPQLPKWLRGKIMEARELYDHVNYCDEDNMWNHVITFRLDDIHIVTFALQEVNHDPGILDFEIERMIDVYKDLQVLLRRYGHPLTIISEDAYEFNMFLPTWFYRKVNDVEESLPAQVSPFSKFTSTLSSHLRFLKTTHPDSDEFTDHLSESDRTRFYEMCGEGYKERLDYLEEMKKVLDSSRYDYYGELHWNNVDLFMSNGRHYFREFCVEWNINESLDKLKRLDRVRPIIEKIIRESCVVGGFAYGVKPIDRVVNPCKVIQGWQDNAPC